MTTDKKPPSILPDGEYVSADDVAGMLGVSRRHFVERMSKLPGFPQPFTAGRWRAWSVDELRKYISKTRSIVGKR